MDMPYAQQRPRRLKLRETEVRKKVNIEELESLPIIGDRKHNAFKLYVSQYLTIDGGEPLVDPEILAPEKYWRVLK